MMERLLYYIDLISEVCGFDGSKGNLVFGWIMVTLAALIVVVAFYIWITRSLWPGEQGEDHVKRRILLEDEEWPHAH